MKYNFTAKSPSDPAKGLGFLTQAEAETHCRIMNALLEDFKPELWNMSYWKVKPEPWIVEKHANT